MCASIVPLHACTGIQVLAALQNEINSVYSALRGTRSASGHSGALERRDSNDGTVLATSSMLSQALDSAASSMLSSQQGSVDLDCERLEVEGAHLMHVLFCCLQNVAFRGTSCS